MHYTKIVFLIVAVSTFGLLFGCGRKTDVPNAKNVKDSASIAKDSTSKDSTSKDSSSTVKDSAATASDQNASVKDSAALAKDSIRIADSLARHPMSYEQRQGKYVYAKYCAVCHGVEGKADGFNTYNLDPKPRDLTEQHYLSELSDERIIRIIRDGGRGANKSPSMPPYGWTLSKEDILYVTAFVRTFAPPDSASGKKATE